MDLRKRFNAGIGLAMASLAFFATALSAAPITIHGRVSDAATGASIAGAKAYIYAGVLPP